MRIFSPLMLIAILASSVGATVETVGHGDFEFFLDTAAFRSDDGSTRQDVYIRLPNSNVRFKLVNDVYEARVRLSLRITDSAGATAVEESSDFQMYAADLEVSESPLQFHTLTRQYGLAEGAYSLSVAIEDLNSPKVTVVGMIKGEVKTATVNKWPIEAPAFPEDRMSLSDPRFLWSRNDGGVPNPSRIYGLYRDSLLVYVEAYLPEDIAQEHITLGTTILNEAGEVLKESSARVLPRETESGSGSRAMSVLLTEDLNRLVAGTYTLYIDAGVDNQLLTRVMAGSFNVAWDMRTWEVSRRSFISEARFLLEEEEFDRFTTKSAGEQEAILRAMWTEIDPDPNTGVNEAHVEFMDRLEYVNAKYTDYQLGIFTDRGLIFLKYGPPDEVIVDVIPLNRESISDALQKVQDKYHAVNFSNTGARIGYATPSKDIIVDPRRLGSVGEGGDAGYPYELWIYNGPGQPIRAQDRAMEPDIGMRFIFVDSEGYGRYSLESSSSMANK